MKFVFNPLSGAFDVASLTSGSVEWYVHTQSSPSSSWIINHNLEGYPNVTAFNVAGAQIEGLLSYTNIYQVVLTFNSAVAGSAVLNA